jgi:ribose-phosphate pyrophosphokinase
MKILNLTNPEQSEVKFKVSSFPDGQQDVIIEPFVFTEWKEMIQNRTFSVQIQSRFTSWKDLELIVCANQALKRLKVKEVHLYIPYLLGARSDRQFVEGGTSYLVDTLTPIINLQDFASVTMMDCHSDVGMGLIKNSKNISNVKLVQWALKQIDNTNDVTNNVAIVSPDGGALKKIYDTTLGAKLECDIILSAKHRDVKIGTLNGFDVPIKESQIEKSLVWIDDIADGGGTFIGEAQKANEMGHKGKKYLIVTHGIFSQGFEELSKHFDGIFCTNSYCDALETFGPYSDLNGYSKEFVKQLNIF